MNGARTVDLMIGETSRDPAAGLWCRSLETPHDRAIDLLHIPEIAKWPYPLVSTTSMPDPWSSEQLRRDATVTVSTTTNKLLLRDLGWTREQAIETRLRLRGFEEDWDAPGMEIYDEL